MSTPKDYFFCGIGGSGMLPLAMIVQAGGARVEGSDRALDQGRTGPKFDYLRSLGVGLFPQDGSGLTRAGQVLVASAAIEDTVPDVIAAEKVGAGRLSRAALLAELFNTAPLPIGVAGTSGKSTTTAMIGWILHEAGKDPTIMNGAVMKNFVTPDALFASALVGRGDAFVSEIDESDGSIAMFNPKIAVLNNISEDHKSMDELRTLFGDFVARSAKVVLNLDNPETASIARNRQENLLTYSIDRGADFTAKNISPEPYGVAFDLSGRAVGDERALRIRVRMPGRHNVSNALAAIAAAHGAGVDAATAAAALDRFEGVRRRLEYVGEAAGVSVIDDFGHNPDKIAASLNTLHEFEGRLLVMFQPHGFGPLRKMKTEFITMFAQKLTARDVLVMPEPVYFGGTVERSVSSGDIAAGVAGQGRRAEALPDREACGERLLSLAQPGDRIIVMGARDDTLSVFAQGLLSRLEAQATR